MAGTSLNISDYGQALRDGTIPGEFAEGRRVFNFPEVRSVNTHGATLVWSLSVRLYNGSEQSDEMPESLFEGGGAPLEEGACALIRVRSYQISADGVRGADRAGKKDTEVRAGKNLGRKNATTPLTQAFRDALSLYNKQKQRAAPPSRARACPGAKLLPAPPREGFQEGEKPPPMLVKKEGATVAATLTDEMCRAGVMVQRKYNGVRAVAFLHGDRVVIYSRTGHEYPGLEKIRTELKGLLSELRAPTIEFPLYLDGELYLHGKSLQWISGQARGEGDARLDEQRPGEQHLDEQLEYHVYDCFLPKAIASGGNMPNIDRQAILNQDIPARYGSIRRAEYEMPKTVDGVLACRDRYLAEGYEGAIVRKCGGTYRYGYNGYHSSDLMKLKPLLDAEFKVVGFADGKRGKDVGAVLWICEVDPEHTPEGGEPETFTVTPKDMSYETRYAVFEALGQPAGGGKTLFERHVAGCQLTVEFPERTAKGKPAQAKAVAFRNYEDGGADPLARVLAAAREK